MAAPRLPIALASPNWRYAATLTLAAFVLSQPFALLCFVVVGGVRAGAQMDWGFLLMFEICAGLTTLFAGLGAGVLAWSRSAFGPGLAAVCAIAAVMLARIVTASLYFAALTLPYAIAASLALSWLLPEIIAGLTAFVLHRRIFGAAARPEVAA